MLTRFLSNRTNTIKKGLNFIYTKPTDKISTEWQIDLDRTKKLYEEKKYEEALKQISQMETKYHGCSKVIQHYRGKVGIALLEESGELKKLKPSI